MPVLMKLPKNFTPFQIEVDEKKVERLKVNDVPRRGAIHLTPGGTLELSEAEHAHVLAYLKKHRPQIASAVSASAYTPPSRPADEEVPQPNKATEATAPAADEKKPAKPTKDADDKAEKKKG